MYAAQDEQRLYKQAKALLEKTPLGEKEAIEQLRDVINYSNWKYYVKNAPVLSDSEFDKLFKQLKDLEEKFPELIVPDSPTQKVGSSLSSTTTTTTQAPSTFSTVQHLAPMLSLDNTYSPDDLLAWDKRCKKITNQEIITYCIEPKFDGASISLVYSNDKLVRAATRGDGIFGDDITINALQIKGIPKTALFSKEGHVDIELRGEVVMTKKNFQKFNQTLIENNQSPLANTRNAASGTLRLKNPEEVKKRMLEAYIYQISYSHDGNKSNQNEFEVDQFETIKYLNSKGFQTSELNNEICCFDSIENVIDFVLRFEDRRDTLDYEIDGMVIKVNSYDLRRDMGMTNHHPRWAVAYKFKPRQATSRLVDVGFQVGRTGSITPVAKIEPVPIGGVTISSISLFNEDIIKAKDLKKGDVVLVERAGDVIPYIVKSLPELRTGDETEIVFPLNCPVCNSKLEKSEDEAVWRCGNYYCPAQVIERIIHFTSKDAMDIRGLGGATVQKFNSLALLNDVPDIYYLNWEAIQNIGGFGKKSVENLKTAIDNSKQQPLNRLIFGLGIRHVGETMAKTLANAVNHITDFYDWDEEALLKLEDVGPKVARSIIAFFNKEENKILINKLSDAGVNLANQKKNTPQTEGGLSGKTFLFTGTLNRFKRSEAEEMVEEKGGAILGGVSSKLNYLVVGADAGSKLEKAKKLGTVAILTEDEFLDLIKGN